MRRRRLRLLALILVLVATITPALAPGQTRVPPSDPIQDMAAKIGRLPQVKGKKIGVDEFRMADGKPTQITVFVGELLEVALTRQSSSEQTPFDVVTRNYLCRIMRENKLRTSDQVDPEATKKIGMLSDADFLIPGRVTELGNRLQVTLRLLETETGKQKWAEAFNMPLDDGLRKLVNAPAVGESCGDEPATTSQAPAADPNKLQVKVWADKASYRIGEPLQIRVRANRDAYVTLVDIGTSGQVTVLYPNRFHQNNFVRGGQDVLIPPADASFALAVQGPRGMEQIKAIATEEPVSFAPSDFSNPNEAFRSLNRNQTRNISVEKSRAIPTKWAEDVIALEIRP
jgi:hypothetical protein